MSKAQEALYQRLRLIKEGVLQDDFIMCNAEALVFGDQCIAARAMAAYKKLEKPAVIGSMNKWDVYDLEKI